MKTLELKSTEWARGKSSSLYNPGTGMMCCLGIYEKANGVPTVTLADSSRPTELRKRLDDGTTYPLVGTTPPVADAIRKVSAQWQPEAPQELIDLVYRRLTDAAPTHAEDRYGYLLEPTEGKREPTEGKRVTLETLAIAVNDEPYITDKVRVFLLNKIFPVACNTQVRFRETSKTA